MSRGGWVRVTRAEPCPVCKRSTWCGRSADGKVVRCSRVESSRPSRTKAGEVAYIHELDRPLPEISPDFIKKRTAEKLSPERVAEMVEDAYRVGADTRKELAVKLGIRVDALERLRVGRMYDEFRNCFCSTWPERNLDENLEGQFVNIVRRYNQPVTPAGGNKLSLKGGTPGVYFHDADFIMGDSPLFVVEGGTDTAALLSIGVLAIGRPSCVGGGRIVAELLRKILGTKTPVVVVAENDFKPDRVGLNGCQGKECDGCMQCWPGLAGARAVAKTIGQAIRRKTWICSIPNAKDSREWVQKHPWAQYRSWREAIKVEPA